ncbi:MAG: Mur ligase family protein [Chloroflexi bacterium]|nr:Mur ligase family protein [Chloroflexota bacterium]
MISVPKSCPDIEARLWSLARPSPPSVGPTLGRMRDLLERLGHPERDIPAVLVGGTSGKGSTSYFLASILRSAGYTPGLHTKPHLHTVRERFQIGSELITCDELDRLLHLISPAVLELQALHRAPTWFEVVVTILFLWLRDRGARPNVVEVGLGGSWDATNVLHPLLSVLTTVGLDHMEILGSTIERIAVDKVGIIKPQTLAVSGPTQPSVINIVKTRVSSVGTELWQFDEDVTTRVHRVDTTGAYFDLKVLGERLPMLHSKPLGAHQVLNAALASAAAIGLRRYGYDIRSEAIRDGLATCEIPGRLERAGAHPDILLDGAHNPEKLSALAEAVRVLFAGRRTVWVCAMRRGHDPRSTLAALRGLTDRVICTRFKASTDWGVEQSQPPEELAQVVMAFSSQVTVEHDARRALDLARESAGADGLVIVTGSLYLVGELRAALAQE